MTSPRFVCLSLGSNLGNRFDNFRKAYLNLKELGIQDLQSSVILETKALLLPNSPETWDLPFFNSVIIGKTSLSPSELLKKLKNIENLLGRDLHAPAWSPRTLDIDILLYGDGDYQDKDLTIPHSGLLKRPFLISLIAALCPDRQLYQPNSPYHLKTFGEIAHLCPCPREMILNAFSPTTFCMGIVNVTDNSMSDGGEYLDPNKAVEHAEKLFSQGASIIDFGAQSTNPKVKQFLSVEEEWKRLEPVLQLLSCRWSGCAQYPYISIDTFYPEIAIRACNIYPIHWINDVSGGSEKMIEVAKELGTCLVVNHSCSLPPCPEATLDFTSSPVDQLLDWGRRKIEFCDHLGLDCSQIIFDPGIGFGTTSIQAMYILQKMQMFRELGCPLLVGHSRKSCFSLLGKYDPKDRDWETAAISILLQQQRVDYLRVHDVAHNQRALSASAWCGQSV
ncbi:dihydropteroate synthase [Chlamydia avium]|uniref:Folate synthesis bifunctional protein n=1 Tax=Chlamydia avium 10DC88 TaxID=1229831 RepID=W8JMW2_9CHLA|nr:dihydropteroate synthase [Chlamydia avium]AHK63634.1 Folate synthesis bifunctional protein [Chlamydia avium 10DC88]